MDDGWDLYAVVRSCTAAAAADTGSIESNRDSAGDAGSGLNKLTFENEDDPFCFSGLAGDDDGDSFQGLEEIYKELCVNNQQPITTTTHIAPTATVPIVGEFEEQRQQQVEIKESSVGSYISFPAANLQTVRPRRRKNQQKKVVKQMTQEELGGDSWAWRKYGQKPIKGSPYPRNYYRCSSSKGCAARKQVERSPADSAIFIVSYTGEHTHPRPTHRSSLAGSTRNKLSDTVMTKPTYGETSTTAAPNVAATGPSCSISSPTSVSSLSPVTTPLTEDVQMEDLPDSSEMAEAGDMEDDDDGEMLIPNAVMAEDIFKGFQELGGSNIDSDLNFILSPSGTTGSTTGTATNFGLRGGF